MRGTQPVEDQLGQLRDYFQRCYNLGALKPPSNNAPMHPTGTRRGNAFVLPLGQAGVGLVGALLVLAVGGAAAAAAFAVGAAVIAVGHAMFDWRTVLRSPVVPAQRAFARLLLGSGLKWLVIGAGLALAMTRPGWPAEFVLGGALAVYLAYVICLPWLIR